MVACRLVPLGLCGQLAQRERRASQSAVSEASDLPAEPDGHPVIVELFDHGEFVFQVARADLAGEDHGVPDAELRDRGCGADGVQQLSACVYRVSDRDEMLVKFAGSDLVKQVPLRDFELPVVGH